MATPSRQDLIVSLIKKSEELTRLKAEQAAKLAKVPKAGKPPKR